MKITEIKIKFDSGGTLEFQDPKGFNLGDIPGLLGLLPGDEDDPTSLKGMITSFIPLAISLLMKRVGL